MSVPAAGLSSPGAALAAARQARGLSPAQVAEQLRLTPETVVAMEEGHYEVLGPPVFARGHLRKYSSLLGRPADELLRDYDASSSRVAESTLIPPASAHTHVKSERSRPLRWQPWVAVIIVALVAMAGWWLWKGRITDEPVPQPAGAQTEEVLEAPASAAFGEPADEPGPAAPSGDAQESPPAGGAAGQTSQVQPAVSGENASYDGGIHDS